MVSFKLCISDPKTGKTLQKEVKDAQASPFIGLNIGQTVKGETIDLTGYEFELTGGSDFCGFPMRRGIQGIRKRIVIGGGVGVKQMKGGQKRRKTVCGHKVTDQISQINLKVTKAGSKALAEALGSAAEAEGDAKDAPADAPKESPKEEKKEAKPEEKKEEKK